MDFSGHRIAVWNCSIALPFLLLSAAASGADAPPKTCTLQEIVSLDMQTLQTGEFAVPVMLNDLPAQLLVNTGSEYTAITDETAEELGAREKWTPYGGSFLNNVAINEYAYLDSFRIGPLHSSSRWQVVVIPNEILPYTISGLLAYDMMRNYDIEYDFFHGKFNVFMHSECPGSAVYWTHDAFAAIPIDLDRSKHITVEASLDGKPVSVIFDTGSPSSIMSLDAARRLFGWPDADPRLKSLGTEEINGGTSTPLYAFPFATLSFAGVSVSNPQIRLIPQDHFDAGRNHDANIVLGMSVLRQLRIYVAYDEKVVYLTGAEAQ